MNKQEIRKENNSATVPDSRHGQLREHVATALLHSITDEWFSTLTRDKIRNSFPLNSGAKKLDKDLSFERWYGRGAGGGELKAWTKKVYYCTLIILSEIFGGLLASAEKKGIFPKLEELEETFREGFKEIYFDQHNRKLRQKVDVLLGFLDRTEEAFINSQSSDDPFTWVSFFKDYYSKTGTPYAKETIEEVVDTMKRGETLSGSRVWSLYRAKMSAFAKLDSTSLKSSIEAISESPANQQKIIETAERLESILQDIKRLTREAQELVGPTPQSKSAELFWMGDIFGALDHNHNYGSRSMSTMQQSIDSLKLQYLLAEKELFAHGE